MTEHNKPTKTLEPGWHTHAATDATRLRELYVQLDELASGQHEMLDASRTDDLLDLLSRRSGIIEQIKELADELQPVISGWDRLGASVPEPVRSNLQGAFDDIGVITRSILTRDSAHTEVLEKQRTQIATELTSVDRGRAAVNANSGQPGKRPQTPHFQDRQG